MGIEEALATNMDNYASIGQNLEDAHIEFDRVIKEKFVAVLSPDRARRKFPNGIISKQALIVKVKKSALKGPTTKRRIIVDLKRSGANSKSLAPQRIVLPRPLDVVNDIRDTAEEVDRARAEASAAGFDLADWATEIVTADLSDDYQHFRVHPDELEACLTRDEDLNSVLLWIMLGFGFDSAPLFFGRFAAGIARILQGVVTAR